MTELSVRRAAADARDRIGLVITAPDRPPRAYTFGELAALIEPQASPASDRLCVRIAEPGLDTVLAIYRALDDHVPLVLVHARATDAELTQAIALCANIARDQRAGLAVVLFTSGSTGHAKGVMLGRRALIASAAASAAHLGWRDDDRWLCCLPLAHIGGLSIVTRALIARRTAVVDAAPRFDPAHVAAVIAEQRVTLASFVPTMLTRLLDAGWSAPDHLRAVLVGGAAASPALIERARQRGVAVLVTYGMTEACSQVATQELGTRDVTRPAPASRIGPPLPGIDVRITDGRIAVRGPMLFRGYLGGPDAPAIDDAGWFFTGDRGWIDDDGALHVLGRADDMIITGGENVAPAEVEARLLAHPQVAAACVFGVPDPTWGQRVACALVARDPSLALSDLARFLADGLATYKRPRLVCVVDALPLGHTGKPDRKRVIEQVAGALIPMPD